MTGKLDALIRDLGDADFQQRPQGQVAYATPTAKQAKVQLIALGKEAVPAVLDCLLGQGLPHQRAMAAQVLGEIGDAGAVNALIEMLHDPEMLVRGFSAEALGKIGDKQAISPLRDILGRPGEIEMVKAFAGGALDRLGENAAPVASKTELRSQKGPLEIRSKKGPLELRLKKGPLWKAILWIGILMIIFGCLTIGLTLFSTSDSTVVAIDWPAILGCTGTAIALGGLLVYLATRPVKEKN